MASTLHVLSTAVALVFVALWAAHLMAFGVCRQEVEWLQGKLQREEQNFLDRAFDTTVSEWELWSTCQRVLDTNAEWSRAARERSPLLPVVVPCDSLPSRVWPRSRLVAVTTDRRQCARAVSQMYASASDVEIVAGEGYGGLKNAIKSLYADGASFVGCARNGSLLGSDAIELFSSAHEQGLLSEADCVTAAWLSSSGTSSVTHAAASLMSRHRLAGPGAAWAATAEGWGAMEAGGRHGCLYPIVSRYGGKAPLSVLWSVVDAAHLKTAQQHTRWLLHADMRRTRAVTDEGAAAAVAKELELELSDVLPEGGDSVEHWRSGALLSTVDGTPVVVQPA